MVKQDAMVVSDSQHGVWLPLCQVSLASRQILTRNLDTAARRILVYIKAMLRLGGDYRNLETCPRRCKLLKKKEKAILCRDLGLKPSSVACSLAISPVGKWPRVWGCQNALQIWHGPGDNDASAPSALEITWAGLFVILSPLAQGSTLSKATCWQVAKPEVSVIFDHLSTARFTTNKDLV